MSSNPFNSHNYNSSASNRPEQNPPASPMSGTNYSGYPSNSTDSSRTPYNSPQAPTESPISQYGSNHQPTANAPHAATAVAAQQTDASQNNAPAVAEPMTKLARELDQFNKVAAKLREEFVPAGSFEERCQQAFDIANDLFGHAPTWVCFYRALLGGSGMIHMLFDSKETYGNFLRTEQYHQVQMMLTALRSRDLPENDPNDPQRMITVRLPKSLHEAMCDEAERLNISVNRLCISRMLQLLDPKMIPETNSKPRGRKPRTRSKPQ